MAKYFRYKKLPGEQRNKTNLELWFDAMDWSKIETLGVLDLRGQHYFLDEAAPRLGSLKNLEIWGATNNTLAFITSLEPKSLTNLTWIDGWKAGALDTILDHHGQSLRHLDIHSHESGKSPSPAFSNAQLRSLVDKAPNLNYISINVHRNGTWPFEVFDTLASMPSLESVDLMFDITSDCQRQKPERYTTSYTDWERNYQDRNGSLPCQGEERFQQPVITEESSLEIFRLMRAKKVGKGVKRVTFWAGDWSRGWDGPLYTPPWIEGRRAKVLCTTEGKAEGEAWCTTVAGGGYWKKDAPKFEDEDDY